MATVSERSSGSGGGIGLGSVIAAILSILKWHSFWWMIVHGFCGWGYVAYYVWNYGIRIG